MNEITTEELAVMIMEFIGKLDHMSTTSILAALSVVTGTVACEAGYEEEKAVYAFRKCYREAQRRINRMRKNLN